MRRGRDRGVPWMPSVKPSRAFRLIEKRDLSKCPARGCAI